MAYVTICQPCLDGRHDKCLVSFDHPPPDQPEMCGGALCVCAHGGEESAFQRGVREGVEAKQRGEHRGHG